MSAVVVLALLVAASFIWSTHGSSSTDNKVDRSISSVAGTGHGPSALSEPAPTGTVRAPFAAETKDGQIAPPSTVPAPPDDDLPCWLLVFDLDSAAPLEHVKITAELGIDQAISYTDEHGLARVEGLKTQMRLLQLDTFGYSTVFLDTEPGHESAQRAWRVPMSRTATLIVHLRDVTGALVPDIQVTLESVGDESRNRHLTRLDAVSQGVLSIAANTDATGSVTIALLPAAIPFQATVFRPRAWSPAERIVLDPGEVREVEWTMSGGCLLHGLLLDQQDQPVAQHVVWLLPAGIDEAMYFDARRDHDPITVTTDERGRFICNGLDPATWWIGPAPSNADSDEDSKASKDPALDVAPIAQVVRIAEGQVSADVILHVDRGLYIRGHVLDPGGDPMPDARVQVRERERSLFARGETTDADGAFVVGPLTRGTYTVVASRFAHYGDSEPQLVEAGDADIVLHLRAGAEISGQVIGDDGAGASAEVRLSDREETPRHVRGMHTEQNGHFSIRGLSPGAFDVVATTDDGRIGWVERVGIAEGATVKGVIVRVTRGGLLRVRHTGPEESVDIEVLEQGAMLRTSRALRNMPVELTVPAGTVVVRARYSEGDRRTIERTVAVAVNGMVEVVLDAGAR